MTVNKITTAPTSNEVTEKINEIIDNLGGSIVDQTYDPTSINAQSGVAIAGAGFLQNKGTGTNSLALIGTATGNRGVGLGQASEGSGAYSSGLGTGAKATGNYAIQIGYGTNSTASTLSIGFNASSSANRKNWELLDGTTGLIPDARLSSNIARTSDVFSRNIGEIVTSTIPLTDAGLHLLDGSLISGSGSYADFVTYIAGLVSTYPDLFETEANWQTAVTTYGVCGKFVYDSVNNTVRLPKITGIIEGTTDLTALGDLVQAGLPNITGSINGLRGGDTFAPTGAITKGTGASYAASAGSGSAINPTYIYIDASVSNSIYGNSTTVQPQTIKVLYYIVISTSTKTEIQSDIDEIAADLNGKADIDLSNVPTSKGILSESYVNGTSWYRVYSDGWCEQGGITSNTESASVTFLQSFTNTNYTIVATQISDSSYNNNVNIRNKTASGVVIWANGAKTWVAYGYIR